jgi:hypothetical protein
MKLFIWSDPYSVPYGSSMFFAVADSVEHARKIAKEAKRFSYGKFEQPAVPWTAEIILGEPDRILDMLLTKHGSLI